MKEEIINIYTNAQIEILYQMYKSNDKEKALLKDDFSRYIKKSDVVGIGCLKHGYFVCKYVKGIYIVSHNATKNLRSANILAKKLLLRKENILFFVPVKIGRLLKRIGYREYNKIWNSEFRSRPMLKKVYYANECICEYIEYVMNIYLTGKISTVGMVDPESNTYWNDVEDYINKILGNNENKNNP